MPKSAIDPEIAAFIAECQQRVERIQTRQTGRAPQTAQFGIRRPKWPPSRIEPMSSYPSTYGTGGSCCSKCLKDPDFPDWVLTSQKHPLCPKHAPREEGVVLALLLLIGHEPYNQH